MSAQVLPFLPDLFRSEAVRAGLDDIEIAKRFRKRSDWVLRNRGPEATVTLNDWRAEIAFAVQDARKLGPKPLTPEESARLRVVHEDQAKRKKELQEARANAVSFETWIRGVTNGTYERIPCERCNVDHVADLAAWWQALPEPRPKGSEAIWQWMASTRKTRGGRETKEEKR